MACEVSYPSQEYTQVFKWWNNKEKERFSKNVRNKYFYYEWTRIMKSYWATSFRYSWCRISKQISGIYDFYKFEVQNIDYLRVIVLPKRLFNHVQYYVNKLRTHLNSSSDTYLLVWTDNAQINHVAIGRALTASFSRAGIFTKYEYTRVSPTLIRCSCATFECKEEGVDSGFFAKHFMKNKEDTTNIHYILYPNYREALKIAMLMGDTFEWVVLKEKWWNAKWMS